MQPPERDDAVASPRPTGTPLIPKVEARTLLHRTRAALPEEHRSVASAAIQARLLAIPELRRPQDVHCYLSRSGDQEVETEELIQALAEMGHTVFLPVVVGRSRIRTDAPRILEAPYAPGDTLITSPFGIDEPPAEHGRRLASSVAVIPGLGVGSNAVRVGHGWGYYDELLAGSDAFIVQLCFDACVIGPVASHEHDVAPACVITETRILRNRDSRLV